MAIGNAKSPQIPPPTPVHVTIPLPEVDDCDHGANIGNTSIDRTDATQLQQLQIHQQRHGLCGDSQTISYMPTESQQQQQPIVHDLQTAAIDLVNLSISGGGPTSGDGTDADSALQGRKQFGIPHSHSQPLGSAFDTNHHANSALNNAAPNNAPFHSSVSESALGGDFGSGMTREQETDSGVDPSQKTPNVYINGLPPHYPEDELFNLASEFGSIRSVRTFTRHVRDSESGYGFVL